MNFVTRCALTVLFAFAAVVLGASAHAAENISKVNGSVKVEPGQQVGDVDTVNGSVTIGAGARAGDVETVNGSLKIEDKAVVGSAETVNGHIRLATGSQVTGGIHVQEHKSWWKGKNSRNPRITIEQGVTVEGPLHFEREVELYVAPGVTLPPVEGVQPQRFTLQ